jgi:hypothetical protein
MLFFRVGKSHSYEDRADLERRRSDSNKSSNNSAIVDGSGQG